MPGAEIAFFVLPMSKRHANPKDGFKKVMTGFRRIVHARQGLMLGIRQPLNGPIFSTAEVQRPGAWML